jgi:hypothetical protein
MACTIEKIRASTAECLEPFSEIMDGVSYEDKGVLFSEVFFIYAALQDNPPKRIIESGRARGQSTLCLSLCFPDAEIVSLEFDPDTPDVPVAAERLSDRPNVRLEFGDAREKVLQWVEADDVIMIDGPKDFPAVQLAFELLQTGKPEMAFIHDCHQASRIRNFLESKYPACFFSDDEAFVELTRHLDDQCWDDMESMDDQIWRPGKFCDTDSKSYGPTFACLPYCPDFNYKSILKQAAVTKFTSRVVRSVKKRLG